MSQCRKRVICMRRSDEDPAPEENFGKTIGTIMGYRCLRAIASTFFKKRFFLLRFRIKIM